MTTGCFFIIAHYPQKLGVYNIYKYNIYIFYNNKYI